MRVATLCLALAAVTALAGAAPVALDVEGAVPYAFNEATVSCRDGLSGTARIYGTDLSGERHLLFETRPGYAESLVVRYYAWPELASLSFEGHDGDGLAVISVAKPRFDEPGPESAALSALEFPFRLTPLGPRPRIVPAADFADGSPETAARLALSGLFAAGRRAVPLTLLTLWTLAVITVATWKRGPRGQSKAFAIVACVFAIAASLAAYALGAAPAELYSVAILDGSGQTDEAREDLRLVEADRGDYVAVSWDAASGAAPGLRLVGVRSPVSATVPVSAFDAYRRIRFRYPPLVVRDADGAFLLAPAPFRTAWGLHE